MMKSGYMPTPQFAALFALLAALFPAMAGISPLWAGEADVVDVKVSKQGAGSYNFSVTLKHADTGWKHYANRWEVLSPDKKVLATRTLHHPHVEEQPFTRSLSSVRIPDGISQVILRANDSVHGTGGREMAVDLPGRAK